MGQRQGWDTTFTDPHPVSKPSHCFLCTAVNCGLVYIQNAARDGTAAWILAELVDRSLRVWENITGVQVVSVQQPTQYCAALPTIARVCSGHYGCVTVVDRRVALHMLGFQKRLSP